MSSIIKSGRDAETVIICLSFEAHCKMFPLFLWLPNCTAKLGIYKASVIAPLDVHLLQGRCNLFLWLPSVCLRIIC